MRTKSITLYEPVSLAFVLIAGLIFLFSGALGKAIWNGSMRDCEAKNVQLLQDQREGPLNPCGR